jgi:CRISPR-associated protein Csm1
MDTPAILSRNAALQVLQQAIAVLAKWADIDTVLTFNMTDDSLANKLKGFLSWINQSPETLQLVFDRIHPSHGQLRSQYRPALPLDTKNQKVPLIPYAQSNKPTEKELENLKQEIRETVKATQKEQWQNLSYITLFLEKFGSHVSLGEPDVALIDLARTTAAVAAALSQNPPEDRLTLIAGDLMGVQKFIYTISSKGALKSLRARSFYLELATEEIVFTLLQALKLPRTNIIYAGASKFYLLAADTEKTQTTLEEIQSEFNSWLRKTFQNKVFLALSQESLPISSLKTNSNSKKVAPLATIWQSVNIKLASQSGKKFKNELNQILESKNSYQPCKVCHRDDLEKLHPLNPEDDESVEVCPVCRAMFYLGDELPQARGLLRTPHSLPSPPANLDKTEIYFPSAIYRLVQQTPSSIRDDQSIFLINNWTLSDYHSDQVHPLFLGRYYWQPNPESSVFMSAQQMADAATGTKRMAYLRMDVDRLSQIFANGLGQHYTLPRLASLSRQMTYFFKVYLNSLAEYRQENFITQSYTQNFKLLPQKNDRKELLFIYAGGDDLFVSGAWDATVEFAFDVYQAFRAYTGHHPDITLSGGVSIFDAKFPLYQAAQDAGDAEDAAKLNNRDSLSLFGQVFHWDHWLGFPTLDPLSDDYLKSEVTPLLQGIFPIIEALLDSENLPLGYPKSFLRNLLLTAELREQKIKEIETKYPNQELAIMYYIHLPKLTYALHRLPRAVSEDKAFIPIRQSLMSPRNSPYFRAIATWLELLTRN